MSADTKWPDWLPDWIKPPHRPPNPPDEFAWWENLTVYGVDPSQEITATMRVDDDTVYQGVRDTSVPDSHRIQFRLKAPPTHPEWGCHLDIEPPQGYLPQMNLRYTLGKGDHELEPAVTIEREPMSIPGTPTNKRTGIVLGQGQASVDEQGQWHPLGTTFFWAMQGWKWERDRMQQNAAWLRSKGFDYVRILTEVGWENREIDPMLPQWSDYDSVLGEVVDYLYGLGLRVELCLIGKGTRNDPRDIARRVAGVIVQDRQHKVLNFEMCNEYDVGDGVSLEEMRAMADVVRQRCPNLIALSSPGSWEDLEAAVTGPVNAFTYHPDRGSGDAKWRQVRQGYDFKNLRCWASNNEPPGPASSVQTNDNPLQLAMMRAVGVMCGGSGYVLHTGTGVFGNGVGHPTAGPRPANFWEIGNIDAICSAVRNIDRLLPEGVENWQVANTQWTPPNPVAPFQPHEHWEELRGSGVNKAYSALASDGRVIQMPCGVLHHVEMTASYPLAEVTVYDPLTCQPVPGFENRRFDRGQKMDLPGAADSMCAYIIHGRRV